jgi:hypothetical protein
MPDPDGWELDYQPVADYRTEATWINNNNTNDPTVWIRDKVATHLWGSIEPWSRRAHGRINTLSRQVGELQTSQADATRRMGEIDRGAGELRTSYNNATRRMGEIENGLTQRVGGLEAGMRQIPNKTEVENFVSTEVARVNSRLASQDAKIFGISSKLKDVEGDLQKVRSEIKAGNKALNERIDQSDQQTKTEFGDLKILIQNQNVANGGGNGDSNAKSSGPGGEGANGSSNGGTQGGGPVWMVGSRFLSPFGIGNNNAGLWQGLNVSTNGGDFIHAPNCSGYVGTSRHGSCHCMFEEPTNPYGIILRAHRRPTLPSLPMVFPLSSEYHRRKSRRQSFSDTDGSLNWNKTPELSLGFSRDVPGGLFSKPKKEQFHISLGPGGGGGASGRGRRGKSARNSSRDEYW